MITIDRLSFPTAYTPKVGDMLCIKEISGNGGSGRWIWSMEVIEEKLPKEILAWILNRLNLKDASDLMLWYQFGKKLEATDDK